MKKYDLENTDKIFSIIQKFVTIVAIIIGGLWTYNMFIMHRESFPKADISYDIEEVKLSDEYILIQVYIRVKNTGNTVLRLLEGNVRLLDISFPHRKIETEINDLKENEARTDPDFSWRTIQYVMMKWDKGMIEIEPGSTDQLDFEFIIKPKYKVIKIYSWFTNLEKKVVNRWIGWRGSEIYKIKSYNGG